MALCPLLLTVLFNLQILLGPNTVVYGDYILNITLNSYDNNGLCSSCEDDNIGCCDNYDTTSCGPPGLNSHNCETYFRFCMLPRGTSTASRDPVSCTALATSDYTIDGAFIDFSQSTVLGLSNPLSLTGISPSWEGVMVQITAMDFDSNQKDDTVDIFRFEISNRTFGPAVIAGTYRLSLLGFSYEVTCTDRFYGYYCEFYDNCPSLDVCGPNGACVDADGYYYCQCDPMYTGSDCNSILSPCHSVDCSGNGQCMDGIDSYMCMCDVGFTGIDCSINIDNCARIDCSEQGQCMDGIDSYTCQCNAGFTGQDCSVNIDDCAGINCSGQGQCLDGVNSYTCDCDSGRTGNDCEIQGSGGLDFGGHFTFELIIGGTLGSFTMLLCLVILVLIAILGFYCQRRTQVRKKSAATAVLDKFETESISMEMTKNVGYGVCTGQGVPFPDQEVTYNAAASRGSRDYVIHPHDIGEPESYVINNVL